MQKQNLEKLCAQDGQSLDLKADNIAKLKVLFPEILSEKGIDFTVLRQLLGEEIEEAEERYSFTWNGKARARRLAQTPSTGTLRPCKEESKDWDTTQNLFIEGDNLEVLKLLQKSYHQKVKMIYIDPPYNTGKDFIYPDDFRDNIKNYLELTGQTNEHGKKLSVNAETSGRYHTDWLNMMYPRLKLARNLLQENGVIFISLNDAEIENLKKICNEVFGEEQFIAQIVWQRRTSPDARINLGPAHDYVLVYARSIEQAKTSLKKLPLSDNRSADYKNPDNDPRGDWASVDMTGQTGHATPEQFFNVTTINGTVYGPPSGRCWALAERTFQGLDSDSRIWYGKDGGSRPRLKKFLTESDGVNAWTWWSNEEVGHNQEATKDVNSLFGQGNVFDNPKPVRLIKRIFQLLVSSGDIVCDFFAGSGTTAHAAFEAAIENRSSLRTILVQLPEPLDIDISEQKEPAEICKKLGLKLTIAELSKERIRRAGVKVLADNADKPGIEKLDIGFKVFKLDSSNIKPWDADFDTLSDDLLSAGDVIKPERSADDVLFEILLKYGLDLSLPIATHTLDGKTVFEVGAGALLVCLDQGITEAVAEAIGQLKTTLAPAVCRVVFRDAGFADDAAKVNAVQVLKQFGIDDVKSL